MINKKFIRYGVVGALGTIIHLVLLLLLVEVFSLHPVISSSIAFIVVIIISYYLNYTWTFRAKKNHVAALSRYITVCLIGFGINAGIMFIVVDVLRLWYFFGQMISIIVIPVSNFILNSRWAFKS